MSGSRREFKGLVIGGNHLGRKMGIPTINIPVEDQDDLPQFGVYAAEVYVDYDDNDFEESQDTIKGIANIGVKPTVDIDGRSNPVGVEVNLFDFDGDLYGKTVMVRFLDFIRPERKFDNMDELVAQIESDIVTVKSLFGI